MTRVLVTGSEGLIGGYLTEELLQRGYDVTGLDNFSKHGLTGVREHRRYRLIEGDASDFETMIDALQGCDHFVACAAMIGGLGYLHGVPFDLLVANEKLTITAADAAIYARKMGSPLKKVTWISSSMVYEAANAWPSYEGQQHEIAPPPSAYGFQKLAVEYYARAAWEQYQLPYTIIRPFNVIGIRDYPPDRKGEAGRFTSHVVPDLTRKAIASDNGELRILGNGGQVRCYTWAGDLARGIVVSLNHRLADNEDFNIARNNPVTVEELARKIWLRVNPGVHMTLVSDTAFTHDVQRRVPSVEKARRLLGFEALTTLDQMLDQVIPWCRQAVADGRL